MITEPTNHPALFVSNTAWSARFDQDADAARETRHRLLDMAASKPMLVTGNHFPFPATGYIAREGNGYQAGTQIVAPTALGAAPSPTL